MRQEVEDLIMKQEQKMVMRGKHQDLPDKAPMTGSSLDETDPELHAGSHGKVSDGILSTPTGISGDGGVPSWVDSLYDTLGFYDGCNDPIILDNWLFRLESYMKLRKMHADADRIGYASLWLNGTALHWCRWLDTSGSLQGLTWKAFKTLLRKQMISFTLREEPFNRMAEMRFDEQQCSLRDYNTEWLRLQLLLPDVPERYLVVRYLDSLPTVHQTLALLHRPATLAEAMRAAVVCAQASRDLLSARQPDQGSKEG